MTRFCTTLPGLSPAPFLNSGPFPPPELPGFPGTTSLSATPGGPACPSRASGWDLASLPLGLPVLQQLPVCLTCRHHYPGGIAGSDRSDEGVSTPRFSQRRRPSPNYRRVGSHINLSRPARCSLALRPATRRTAQRYVLEGSDGFVTSTAAPIASGWSDQIPGRDCTHWDLCLFTAH